MISFWAWEDTEVYLRNLSGISPSALSIQSLYLTADEKPP